MDALGDSSSLLRKPLLYLSYFFKKHRSEYYDRLQAVRDATWIECIASASIRGTLFGTPKSIHNGQAFSITVASTAGTTTGTVTVAPLESSTHGDLASWQAGDLVSVVNLYRRNDGQLAPTTRTVCMREVDSIRFTTQKRCRTVHQNLNSSDRSMYEPYIPRVRASIMISIGRAGCVPAKRLKAELPKWWLSVAMSGSQMPFCSACLSVRYAISHRLSVGNFAHRVFANFRRFSAEKLRFACKNEFCFRLW